MSWCKDCDYQYKKNKRESDPIYQLRLLISSSVGRGLKIRNSSKQGGSCFKALGFTPQKLMDHLMNHPEKEWWMNENNHGAYKAELWDDDDPFTFVWHIDHKIPHSEFKYTSMDDPEFKKCWALENLRPYSAKQNVIDGGSRVRHNKNKDL